MLPLESEDLALRRAVDSIRDWQRKLAQVFGRQAIDFLLATARPNAPLADRILWLQKIMQWLRAPARSDEQSYKRIETVRLRFVFQLLERNPEWKKNVALTIRSILIDASALELFSLTGLTREPSFFSEAMNRLFRRALSSTVDLHDLGPLFSKIFFHDDDDMWIENLPKEVFDQIVALIEFGHQSPGNIYSNLRSDMIDSLSILGAMIASIGLSHDLRGRMSSSAVADSPFRLLDHRLFEIGEKIRSGQDTSTLATSGSADVEIAGCRERIKDVFAHLEQTGVSIALVYRLETLSTLINRVEVLLSILVPHPSVDRRATLQKFIAELVREGNEGESLSSLIRRNLDLISRKVVERVGQSGEHYITSSPREYWEMFKAGAGGGLITVLTALVKNTISHATLPLFFQGLFSWINYSACFLFMQANHFALATKQPSMTASALANKLRNLNHRRHLKEFVDEVARITRSQFAAALGNVGLVIPGALLADYLIYYFSGAHAMDPHYSLKTIQSLNPITSLTIPAAALTGVILWVSAMVGGWIENWSAYRRFPDAIAGSSFLQALFKPAGAKRLSLAFARSINGIGANIAIGFFLAFTPVLGYFFGAPLDVRHITLSTGALTFAVSSIGWSAVDPHALAWAVLGLIFILALNFGVSFSLALFVAIRARRIKKVWVYAVLRGVLRRFRLKPSQFFAPTRD